MGHLELGGGDKYKWQEGHVINKTVICDTEVSNWRLESLAVHMRRRIETDWDGFLDKTKTSLWL